MANTTWKSSTAILVARFVPSLANVTSWLVIFFATGGGTGYVPVAPGTAGSVLGLLVVRFVFAPLWGYSAATAIVVFVTIFAMACRAAGIAERVFGEHDSSRIVLDEVLGMVATMFLNPIRWPWMLVGFALFRLFDIIKPWPAVRFDRMQGGAGVMFDDLAAGIYANIVIRVIRQII